MIHISHYIAVIFLWFGWLLPKRFLIYHIGFIVLVQIHFLVFDNQCGLTIWEDSLRGVQSSYDMHTSPFLRRMFTSLGIRHNHLNDFIIGYLPVLVSLSISCIRLFILR